MAQTRLPRRRQLQATFILLPFYPAASPIPDAQDSLGAGPGNGRSPGRNPGHAEALQGCPWACTRPLLWGGGPVPSLWGRSGPFPGTAAIPDPFRGERAVPHAAAGRLWARPAAQVTAPARGRRLLAPARLRAGSLRPFRSAAGGGAGGSGSRSRFSGRSCPCVGQQGGSPAGNSRPPGLGS